MGFWNYLNWYIPREMTQDLDLNRRARQFILFSQISPIFFIPNLIKWYKLGSMELAVSIFIVMLLVFFLPFFRIGNQNFNAIFYIFLIMLFLDFAFETMLYRISGVFIFSFFYSIFLLESIHDKGFVTAIKKRHF